MKLTSLLPFMEKEELKELAQKIVKKEVTGVPLTLLFPFLDREDLDDLVEELIKNGTNKEIYSALPFLSKQSVQALYEKVKKGELKGFKEQVLIPFLGKSAIKEIFDTLVKEAKENPIEDDDEDVSDLFDEDDE